MKLKILWEIFFGTQVEDVDTLEERIYQYGSMIKPDEHFSRELFVGMVSLLDELKKQL